MVVEDAIDFEVKVSWDQKVLLMQKRKKDSSKSFLSKGNLERFHLIWIWIILKLELCWFMVLFFLLKVSWDLLSNKHFLTRFWLLVGCASPEIGFFIFVMMEHLFEKYLVLWLPIEHDLCYDLFTIYL